jgi:hypothetical protein
LSRPILRRSTPITTTGLSFQIRAAVDGGVKVRIATWRRRVLLLPPSGGPTQVRTTPVVSFQALIGPYGEVELGVAL